MIRAFTALSLPETHLTALQEAQARLPVPRLVAPDNLHLTLVFLGDVDDTQLEEAHYAFEALNAPAVDITVSGLNVFGGGKPRSVYAQIVETPELSALQKQVERAARGAGIALEHRRFVPHVTLARMRPGQVEAAVLGGKLAAMPLVLPSFRATAFHLYQSELRPEGPRYELLASYPLGALY